MRRDEDRLGRRTWLRASRLQNRDAGAPLASLRCVMASAAAASTWMPRGRWRPTTGAICAISSIMRGKLVGVDGLRAVGERLFGLVVHFDQDAVSAGGDGGAGHGQHAVAPAGAVAGVDQDGQVAERAGRRERC